MGSLSREYIRIAKNDSNMADLLISNSTHLTNIYRDAFWYSGEILECGYPKNDVFFDRNLDVAQKVRDYFGINVNSKIVLYAPTHRSRQDLASYNIDYERVLMY